MEKAYLFKSLGDLLIASQPNSQNCPIAKILKNNSAFI
jgi:hypothetical protein